MSNSSFLSRLIAYHARVTTEYRSLNVRRRRLCASRGLLPVTERNKNLCFPTCLPASHQRADRRLLTVDMTRRLCRLTDDFHTLRWVTSSVVGSAGPMPSGGQTPKNALGFGYIVPTPQLCPLEHSPSVTEVRLPDSCNPSSVLCIN